MDLAADPRQTSIRNLNAGLASWGIKPVIDIQGQQELLIKRRCGQIVVENQRLVAIHGRWIPYVGNLCRVAYDKMFRPTTRDRCDLYYHETFSSPGFLTLGYVRSGPQTSLSTFYATTLVFDEIARLKRSMAIVCNVTNDRISDRLLARWNWQKHCPNMPGRHFIKRLYGEYPTIPQFWRTQLGMAKITSSD